MMKRYLITIHIAFFSVLFCSCHKQGEQVNDEATIDSLINNWHLAAAEADTAFFNFLDPDAIYIGTDAGERWTKEEFISFAKPYFKKGNRLGFQAH